VTFRDINFDVNSYLRTRYALFPAAVLSLISSSIELSTLQYHTSETE